MAMGRAVAPLPITFSRYARAGLHEVAPSVFAPNPPGAIQRQMFATAGLKIEPKLNDLQEAQDLERQFRKEAKHPETVHIEMTDVPGYGTLRAAVSRNDPKAFRQAMNALHEQGKSDKEIIAQYTKWSHANFAWNEKAESQFKAWLKEQGRAYLWSDAQAYKQREFARFLQMRNEAQ